MHLPFSKYQGTGNDFIIIDHRNPEIEHTDTELIQRLCDRKFGIGADGLILLEEELGFHFKMVYFNADGRESSMCGNGGRCIVAFAKQLGLIDDMASFLAIDGPHEAKVKGDWIHLKMNNVDAVQQGDQHYVMDTGSPHYVTFVSDKTQINVFEEGRAIRQSPPFQEEGINVNFVERLSSGGIDVQTYERGVEDETLSCGTGVTAAAIAYAIDQEYNGPLQVPVQTKGGALTVQLNRGDQVTDIWLCGPATFVFDGHIEV